MVFSVYFIDLYTSMVFAVYFIGLYLHWFCCLFHRPISSMVIAVYFIGLQYILVCTCTCVVVEVISLLLCIKSPCLNSFSPAGRMTGSDEKQLLNSFPFLDMDTRFEELFIIQY